MLSRLPIAGRLGRLAGGGLASGSQRLALALFLLLAAYVIWKTAQSPGQALQFAYNGLAVGAIYALMAMGFTLVYSTVWYFDLYYGAAAAVGAYGVFYLQSQQLLGGQYDANSVYVNGAFALVVAGVVAWELYVFLSPLLRRRLNRAALMALAGAAAAVPGAYVGVVLAYPASINTLLSPVVGAVVALAVGVALRAAQRRITGARGGAALYIALSLASVAVGGFCAFLVAGADWTKIYLSWAVACLLAGTAGLAIYRGLYVRMRRQARSPLVMLVASLGILLSMNALIGIIFGTSARPLPAVIGSETTWIIGGAFIKGFNLFAIGAAIAGFALLLFILKRTTFGKEVRAVGDDEEVAKVVGINTTVIIAAVFFIAAMYAALAGILTGHDTAIQPRMGLLLLLKGWIASVVGGIGNLNGALLGGFVLGLVEQFGIWDLTGEWKDAISLGLLVLFLVFWPRGLLPRK